MKREDLPLPEKGIVLTHFVTVRDTAKAAEFYGGVLGGEIVRQGTPTFVKLANSWITLNEGGGPTPDKPTVTLTTPTDLNTVSAFLNIRVADIESVYKEWSAKGAEFLTPPLDNHGMEMRCYMRDPDGHLIEVGQATGVLKMLDELENEGD